MPQRRFLLCTFITLQLAGTTSCASRAVPSIAASAAPGVLPAASDPTPTGAIEAVVVPGSGAEVRSKTALGAGEMYLLRAQGVIDVDTTPVDAEYAGAVDEVGGADVGIDVGRLQIHPAMGRKPVPDGPGRAKWFGPARADHTYYMTITGAGDPLSLKFVPGAAGAARGTITVSLFALSPPPPALGAEIADAREIVSVPVLKVTNTTQLATTAGAVYLLQASGVGRVGGGGLGLGDADYMDWAADGRGKNEGEAGVDFGVGVDEPDVGSKGVSTGAAYRPRQRWWGPFRADHIYYMLFLGTGKPITATYHDSGYGDNSKTDALTFKVWQLP